MTRRGAAVLVVALSLTASACGIGPDRPPVPATPPLSTPPTVSGLTKTADSVVQAALQVIGAKARGARGEELTSLSTGVVHVRADGAVEVTLHANQLAGEPKLDELRQLGVEVVTSVTTPSVPGQAPTSVVQAWVPAERLPAVGALAWIATITPPAYGVTDGGG